MARPACTCHLVTWLWISYSSCPMSDFDFGFGFGLDGSPSSRARPGRNNFIADSRRPRLGENEPSFEKRRLGTQGVMSHRILKSRTLYIRPILEKRLYGIPFLFVFRYFFLCCIPSLVKTDTEARACSTESVPEMQVRFCRCSTSTEIHVQYRTRVEWHEQGSQPRLPRQKSGNTVGTVLCA